MANTDWFIPSVIDPNEVGMENYTHTHLHLHTHTHTHSLSYILTHIYMFVSVCVFNTSPACVIIHDVQMILTKNAIYIYIYIYI